MNNTYNDYYYLERQRKKKLKPKSDWTITTK